MGVRFLLAAPPFGKLRVAPLSEDEGALSDPEHQRGGVERQLIK